MTLLKRDLLLFAVVIAAFLVLFTGNDYAYHGSVVYGGNPKLFSAIPSEGSILLYPYAAVRKTLLASDPNLYRVQYGVELSLPLKLKIQLYKRIPAVILKWKNQWHGLDQTGSLFPLTTRQPGYPVIELAGEPSPSEIHELLQVMNAPLWLKFSAVAMDPNGGLTFSTKEGIIIRVPSLAGIQERFKVLSPLLQVIREKKIRSAYIDLSSEEMPVFRVLSKR